MHTSSRASRTRFGKAGSLIAALMVLFATVGTPVAAAHATRIAADPAEGTTVTAGPERVSATFNEQMQSAFAAMTVVGPDGNLWSEGEPQVAGAVISVGVRPLGPAGTYTVNYRATSADGHVVTGSWSFELSAPGPGAPGPSAAEPAAAPEPGLPVWPFALGVTVITAGAVMWAVRRRR